MVYNGQRLIKSAQPTQTPWLNWVQEHEKWLSFAVVSAGILAFGALLLIGNVAWFSLVLLAISSVISFFYVIRVKGINMREIPYLKIHLIALSWIIVLILFPAFNDGVFNESIVWMAIAHYCYVAAVTIPFDIRDLKFDSSSQKTIPQVYGVKTSKLIALGLLAIFSGIMIWQDIDLALSPLFILAVIVQGLFILFMNESKGDIYCAGGIDGAIALLGLCYLFIN
jgi:4-hydroxybenzoate polyprenyltransferase